MSLNEEKDGEDPSNLPVTQNVQDELVRVIHMSLNNIATQVDNLNKHAEGILGALSKEVDKVSCRYDTLQERVIKLNNNITVKDTEKEFPLQAKKSKSSQSASIQTDLEYPFIPLPAKICETHDASVQTSSLYMSTPYSQDNPQVAPVPSFQEDTENVQFPHYQDDSDDLAIPRCQNSEQDVVSPCSADSNQDLAATPDISHYYKACEETFVAGVNEQVQEIFGKKNQNIDHPFETKDVHQITPMENDITVDHIPSSCPDLSHSRVNPLTTECSAFSSYQINEISKALTQAVGKVLASPPCPQRKEIKYLKNPKSYIRYGVGKKEINLQPQVQIRAKPEMSVSQTASLPPSPSPHDWLTVLKESNTECSASDMHSQTQIPSPLLRTSAATHLCNFFQTSPEVDVKTTEEDNDDFPFPPPPPECLEIIEDDTLEEDNTSVLERMLPSSPILLRRPETNGKASDLLVHASFVQSPPSLDYLSSRPLFPQSPRLSASNSPRSSVLSTPRFSHQPPTKYIFPTYSKATNAALPRHSALETYQSPFPLPESFLQASARCQSTYSPKHSVSPRRFDSQSSRFAIPSPGNIYIDQSTEKLTPPSPHSSGLKSAKSFTLQSLFSFPKSASPSIPNPQALSVFQYSADPVTPDPKRPSVFNKERGNFLDSLRKGVLLRKSEDHCILKAQIEISKK